MRHPRPSTLLSLLALMLAGSLQAQDVSLGERRRELPARRGPGALSGHDRADGRRDWNLYWFGGRATPDYLDQKGRIAQEEARRWAHTLPGPQGRPAPALATATPAWVNLGPTANKTSTSYPDIDNGRPVAIVPHPTQPHTLFLATSGGGVFKCTNANPALDGNWVWTPITDNLPTVGASGNLSVGALAVSPASPDTLYLGLGDAFDAEGRGFYKSTDGGTTWVAAAGMGNATRISAILPLDANRILVGTNDGLKISTDGGATFASASGDLATGRIWTIQKLTPTRLIASRQAGNPGSIYYSSDAGATWTAATVTGVASPGRITLGTSASSTDIAWGMCEDRDSGVIARGLLKTTDGGATWSFVAAPAVTGGLFQGIGNQMTSDGGQSWYNQGFAVDPANVNRVFMGSNLALYRTTDGGANWTQMTHWYAHRSVYAHADFHCSAWSTDGSTLFIGNDGGLMVVRDPYRNPVPTSTGSVPSDVTFIDNRRNKNLASHLIYNLGSTIAATPADSRHRITLGMQDNGTRVRQADGTLQGSGVFEDQIGGDGFGTVIHPENGDQMLGSLYYTRIFKSTDGGTSNFISSSMGITEAGNSSTAPFAPKIALGAASEPNTVFTFVYSKVYKSTDFGSNWTAMNMTGFSGSIRNVNASRSNNQAVAVAASGGRFFVTYNNGTSWTSSGDVTGGTLNTSYVWFDTENPQTLYGATVALSASSSHLFKSTNGGSTWTAIDVSNGFPFGIPVHVIQNQPGNSNLLYAGTDFGVYRSTNGGTTWERFGTGLPMVAVRDLYVAPDGSFVRAATYGRGVYEISTAAPVISVAVNPTGPVTVNPGTAATFKATISNATANTVSWTATGGSLTPTSTAGDGVATTTYMAPATVGTYTVTATSVEDNTRSASATVHVYNPASVAVTVTPGTKSLLTGGTQTFAASATGVPSAGTFTWSATGGSITSGGAYTAPATPGTYTVTATSSWSGVTGTATVTVKSFDLNSDGVVDTLDVLQLAKRYGSAAGADLTLADFDGDGDIDDADLNLLLAAI